MSTYKRGNIYWCKFTVNGRTIRTSTGERTLADAKKAEAHLKVLAYNEAKRIQSSVYVWQEATAKWIEETKESRSEKIRHQDKLTIEWLNAFLIDRPLASICKRDIEIIKAAKLKEGVTNATVNRLLSVVRAILNMARDEWEWIPSCPKVKMLKEPKERVRWLTHSEADKLIRELPRHLKPVVRFALATGLREQNITKLQWQWVDLQHKRINLPASVMKNGNPLSIPLNDDAYKVITEQLHRHDVFVFTYDGKPMDRSNNRAWRNALTRAEIEDFRFHDLRHTWASWHVQQGTKLHELQALGGWSDIRIVMRYAHLSTNHLIDAAHNIDRQPTRPYISLVGGTEVGTISNN